ncbi:MAG: hypothetical protein OSB44_12015, partial [Verrucomicrobiales bacterium]|nr:hypothetical protein [Verrucomicrobiales bacterium]
AGVNADPVAQQALVVACPGGCLAVVALDHLLNAVVGAVGPLGQHGDCCRTCACEGGIIAGGDKGSDVLV